MKNLLPPLLYLVGVVGVGALGGTAWIVFGAAGNLPLTLALFLGSCVLPWLFRRRESVLNAKASIFIGWLVLVVVSIPLQAARVALATPGGDFLQIVSGAAIWLGSVVVSAAFWPAMLMSFRLLHGVRSI